MTSTTSIFFAGVGTSLLLIGAGFGSGLLLGQAAVDVPQKSRTVGSQSSVPPPARVILPAMTAANLSASQTVKAAPTSPPQAEPEPTAEHPLKDVQEQDGEREKQAPQQVEREKQPAARKAAAHERRKRYAAQKARLEAARRHQQQGQQEQQLTGQQQEMPRLSEQPSVLAFGRSEGPNQQIGFFGN